MIGGGFAGLSALEVLTKRPRDLSVTLIDTRETSEFLPMLPDIIGRGIQASSVRYSIKEAARRMGFNFLQSEVNALNLQEKYLTAGSQTMQYDYLIIASGSETNFYGQDPIKKYAFKLDDAEDAQRILNAIEDGGFEIFIISGAGYTGIEVATNIRCYLDTKGLSKKILIVERAASSLGPLPGVLKDYTATNLKRLNIDILLNTTITKAEQDAVFISSGEKFGRAMLIWAAGVKTAEYIQKLNIEKTAQGRLKVDEYLRVDGCCFAAGDTANFLYNGKPIRMAVQFAIAQGRVAAHNIISLIKNSPLKKYRPQDLGYVVPMANNKSCGIIFGIFVKGYLATLLHYIMCIYRSLSLRNKIGIMKDLAAKKISKRG